jgi:hypothetical protein
VSPNYPPVTNWQLAAGRAITPDDDAKAALVVLLGQTVARQLFGATENPIGALVQVKGVPLRVIGLLAAKGQTAYGTDQDDVVMVPFTTGERKVLGVAAPSAQQTPINWVYLPPPNPNALQSRLAGFANQIYLQAGSADAVQPAIRQVTETLQRRHRIKPGETADFAVRNLSQIAETAQSSSRIMALLLAAVASISLLVGGIGIMNILLVSVTERTREIGLRMAIWCPSAACTSAVSRQGGTDQRERWHRRHCHRYGPVAGHFDCCRLACADLVHRDRRRLPVLGCGWDLLRLLPGTQGRPARSDRGATVRMNGSQSIRECVIFRCVLIQVNESEHRIG